LRRSPIDWPLLQPLDSVQAGSVQAESVHGDCAVAAVVFDVDGTLLDSADGIVAGFQYALRSVGFAPPDEHTLRSDLGPPVGQIFLALGLAPESVDEAVAAYRRFYFDKGLARSAPYPGILSALTKLHELGIRLGVATAKRTDVAQAIMDFHGLAHHFGVIAGTDDVRVTKDATLAYALEVLDTPSPAIMVGDRHSDIAAARTCGVRSVGVSWGYGSVAELTDAGAERVIDQPAQLVPLAQFGINAR
jgi:phosphoglycolate phosphatase